MNLLWQWGLFGGPVLFLAFLVWFCTEDVRDARRSRRERHEYVTISQSLAEARREARIAERDAMPFDRMAFEAYRTQWEAAHRG